MNKLCNLIDKVDVKWSTVLLFVISFLFGYIKPIFMYFLIAFIHEFFHLLACFIFKVKIEKFELLPFGACLKTENIELIKSYKKVVIYVAGPASYFFNLIWIYILNRISIINIVNYEFLLEANLIMCLLNLLPIFPLDGYIIIKSLLEILFPYKKSLKISMIVSLLFFVLFVIYNIYDFQPMVLIFLFVEQIKSICSYKRLYQEFLVNKLSNKKERKYKIICDYQMYKETNNYKIEKQKVLDDKLIAMYELKKQLKDNK